MKSLDQVISKGASSLGKELRDKNFPTQSRIYKSEQQFAKLPTCSPSHSCPLALEYPLLKGTGEARVVWGQTWGSEHARVVWSEAVGKTWMSE